MAILAVVINKFNRYKTIKEMNRYLFYKSSHIDFAGDTVVHSFGGWAAYLELYYLNPAWEI